MFSTSLAIEIRIYTFKPVFFLGSADIKFIPLLEMYIVTYNLQLILDYLHQYVLKIDP